MFNFLSTLYKYHDLEIFQPLVEIIVTSLKKILLSQNMRESTTYVRRLNRKDYEIYLIKS